ncbi:MAG: hypothetical protein ABSE00_10705 [Chitinispirillaceae bacterium]|jgi:hypothetical protein
MKNRFFFATLWLCGFVFVTLTFAQDTVAPKIDVMANAAIEEGQFVKCDYTHLPNGGGSQGYIREIMPYSPWLNDEYAELGLRATLNSHFSAIVEPQIKLWNDTWDWTTMGENGSASNPFIQHMTISLADAEGIYSCGSKDALAFTLAAGVFPFKYDLEAKNLGEYLFRTGEHPAYIETSFDDAYATLTGLRLNAQMLGGLSVDVLLTQETQIIPINDWSLSVLAGYKVPNLLDVGAGIMFDRLLPVSGLLDHPDTGSSNAYYTSNGILDTLSWGGTKIMARASFDPKGFLPSDISKIFGKEDGILYTEASILGLSSFTAYSKNASGNLVPDSTMNFYSDIWQRIPVMFGFNIPTFKLLDYLSVELEYYGWPYSPSLYNYENLVYTLPQPIIPTLNTTGQTVLYTRGDSWKYSFNVRKTVWGSLSIIGQIARDHTRHDAYYAEFADPEEVFIQPDEWGWWLKLQYSL